MSGFTLVIGKASRPLAILGIVLCVGAGIALADDATTTDSVASTTLSSLVSDTAATSTDTGLPDAFKVSTSTEDSSLSTTTPPSASTTPQIVQIEKPIIPLTAEIKCDMAYTAELYDTPSGHLDKEYTLATSSESIGPQFAHILGMQSWAECKDVNGEKYEIKLTPQEYGDLGKPEALMPNKLLDLSKTDTYTLLSGTLKKDVAATTTLPVQIDTSTTTQEASTTTQTASSTPQEQAQN